MYNDIMAVGSKERPPMLATGRYAHWQSPKPTTTTQEAVPKHTVPETYGNTTPEKRAYIDAEAESIHIILNLHKESYHKLVDILKQYHNEVNEIRTEKLARNANPLILVVVTQQYPDNHYQAPKPHKTYAPSSKHTPSTRCHAPTRNKGKEIAKLITPPSESASEEEDIDP
ncbi:hypothetical protein Tco_0670751 [Tanacetum coccineum]